MGQARKHRLCPFNKINPNREIPPLRSGRHIRVVLIIDSTRYAVRSLHFGRDNIQLNPFGLRAKPGFIGQDSFYSTTLVLRVRNL